MKHDLPTVDWTIYRELMAYFPSVSRQAKRKGLGEGEAEDTAHAIAIAMSILAEPMCPGDRKITFLTKTKYHLWGRRADMGKLFSHSQSKFDDTRGDNFKDGEAEFFDKFARATTPPNQIEYTFLMECLRKISGSAGGAHPKTLMAMVRGESPLDMAVRSGRPVKDVLNDIEQAREWIAEQFGDPA